MIREKRQWQKGYLNLIIRGYGTERFLNLCARAGIEIWKIAQEEEDVVCCMELPDFYRIRPLVRKTGVRVRIRKRCGLPFALYRNRKRWLLFMGPLLVLLILVVMSLCVWNISIEGNRRYTDDGLMQYLETIGIQPGMRKSKISCSQLEEQIRIDFPEIIWVSAQISGTRLSIKIRENDAVFSIPQKDERPENLVAANDATITRMVLRQGRALVRVGEQVEKGQILAEGILTLTNDSGEVIRNAYVRAEGEIYGKVTHRYHKKLESYKKIILKTGKKQRGICLTVGSKSWKIVLPFGKERNWVERVEEKQLRLGMDFYLPVWYGLICREEIETYERPYTRTEAQQEAEKEKWLAGEKLLEKGVQIIENNVKIQENGFSFIIEGEILCEEQIAEGVELSVMEEENKSEETTETR